MAAKKLFQQKQFYDAMADRVSPSEQAFVYTFADPVQHLVREPDYPKLDSSHKTLEESNRSSNP